MVANFLFPTSSSSAKLAWAFLALGSSFLLLDTSLETPISPSSPLGLLQLRSLIKQPHSTSQAASNFRVFNKRSVKSPRRNWLWEGSRHGRGIGDLIDAELDKYNDSHTLRNACFVFNLHCSRKDRAKFSTSRFINLPIHQVCTLYLILLSFHLYYSMSSTRTLSSAELW